MLRRQDLRGLKQFGPGLVEALEQLAIERGQSLPEAVYREVLPRYQPVFTTLARLASENVAGRRQAADELLASTRSAPLPRLAVYRLSQQVAAESDPLVWQNVLTAVAGDASEPAARLACAAMSHPDDEVRRRACQHLAAHPSPAYVSVLLPALQDSSQAVVIGALRRWPPSAASTTRGRCGNCSAATTRRSSSKRPAPWSGWATPAACPPWSG